MRRNINRQRSTSTLNGTASLFMGSPKKECHFEIDVVRLCKCDAALGWAGMGWDGLG